MKKSEVDLEKFLLDEILKSHEAYQDGKIKLYNQQYDVIENLFDEVAQLPDRGLSLLNRLMDNKADKVRLNAAATALPISFLKASRTLKELDNTSKFPEIGSSAAMCLKLWGDDSEMKNIRQRYRTH